MNTNVKTVSGLSWSLLEKISSQGVGLIVSIILARLVLPEAYGIIAATQVFTGIAASFSSGGIGSALVQKKDADDIDFSSMFLFNITLSIIIYIILFFGAPFFVKILNKSYDYKLLIKVLRIMAIGVVFASIGSFFRSILLKKLEFKKLFFASSIGTFVSAILGVFLACCNYGVWALVAQNLTMNFLNMIIVIFISNSHLTLKFSFARFKPLFSYGFKMMLTSLFITLYADLSSIVIGNRYDSGSLAYYRKGVDFPKLVVVNIISAIDNALFPLMSAISDKVEIKELARKFNRISTFLITPLMFGLAAVADVFIRVIYTERWSSSAIFLKICCFSYAFQPIGFSNLQYLKATGRATEYLVLDIIRKVIGGLLIICAALQNRGIIWVALADLVSNFIAVFINMFPGKQHMGYSFAEQFKDAFSIIILSGVMFGTVNLVGRVSFSSDIILLGVQILTGIIVYIAGAKIAKMNEIKEVWNFCGELKQNKSRKGN